MKSNRSRGINNMQQIIDIVAAQEAAMSVEEWFDTYGVVILKREEEKAARQAKHARMAKLVSGLKAKAAVAGTRNQTARS
jgi:hypothetical protein